MPFNNNKNCTLTRTVHGYSWRFHFQGLYSATIRRTRCFPVEYCLCKCDVYYNLYRTSNFGELPIRKWMLYNSIVKPTVFINPVIRAQILYRFLRDVELQKMFGPHISWQTFLRVIMHTIMLSFLISAFR